MKNNLMIIIRREERKAVTAARNAAKRAEWEKDHDFRKWLRNQRDLIKEQERLDKKFLRHEAAIDARKQREKLKTKTGWTLNEVQAYKSAATTMRKVSKQHLFEKPKVFRTKSGKTFDTEFERDEYIRGWNEYRKWCVENKDAIKAAEKKRNKDKWWASHRIRNMLKAGFFTLDAYDAWLANKFRNHHPLKKSKEHHTEMNRIRNQWRNYRKQVKVGMSANGGRIPAGWVKKRTTEQRGACYYCKADLGEKFEIDHIIPVSKGGPNELWNLQILCVTCNSQKSDINPWEFNTNT